MNHMTVCCIERQTTAITYDLLYRKKSCYYYHYITTIIIITIIIIIICYVLVSINKHVKYQVIFKFLQTVLVT